MPLYLRLPEVLLRFVVADSVFKVPLGDFVVRVSFHVSLSFVTQLFASGRPLPLLWAVCPKSIGAFPQCCGFDVVGWSRSRSCVAQYVFSFIAELAAPQAVRPCEPCFDDGAG